VAAAIITQTGIAQAPPAQTAGPGIRQTQTGGSAQTPNQAVKEAMADTLFRTENYVYKPLPRDPFRQLVVKKGEGSGETDVTSLDVSNITLTGILWGPSGRLAMVNDSQGVGYVLSEGDNLIGGRVAAITDSSIIFEQGEAGQKIRFAVKLSSQGGALRIKD
jgi:hypothetical protein